MSSARGTGTSRLRETIINCLSKAQSGSSYEDQQKALRILASITKVSPQYRNLVAQADNGAIISTLLSLSSSSSPVVIKALSLSILLNLSLNPDLKLSLASMETIYCLNSIIQSPTATTRSSQETAKLASSLICSLAMLDKNKAKFGVGGTVQVLIDAISSSVNDPDPAAHHLLTSLAELVQFHGNSTLAVRSGAIPVLIQVIGTSNALGSEDDLKGTSLAVLGLLARFDEGLNTLTKNTQEIVRSMVDVLRGRSSMFSKEGAADILLRLFEEKSEGEGEGGDCGFVKDALMLPELCTLLADLSIRGSVKARERAALLMNKYWDPFNTVIHHTPNNSMQLYQW